LVTNAHDVRGSNWRSPPFTQSLGHGPTQNSQLSGKIGEAYLTEHQAIIFLVIKTENMEMC
jgi:hypothetical protein